MNLENLSPLEAREAVRFDATILTETGPMSLRNHWRGRLSFERRGLSEPCRFRGTLRRCVTCSRLVCGCNGGTDAGDCDDCWARERLR